MATTEVSAPEVPQARGCAAKMDPAEDQAAELEALEAIFMDEFMLKEPPSASRGARFQIMLTSDVTPDVKIQMGFEHALDYPESPLVVSATTLSGLSGPRRKAVQAKADECAEENLGFPSAFTVCEAVKEWIEENVADGGDAGENEEDEEESNMFETRDVTMAAKVEVIASKAIGTPVTADSFSTWRDSFLAEIEAKKTAEEKARESDPRPTGRQLFELKKAVVSGESESFWEQEAEEFVEEAEAAG